MSEMGEREKLLAGVEESLGSSPDGITALVPTELLHGLKTMLASAGAEGDAGGGEVVQSEPQWSSRAEQDALTPEQVAALTIMLDHYRDDPRTECLRSLVYATPKEGTRRMSTPSPKAPSQSSRPNEGRFAAASPAPAADRWVLAFEDERDFCRFASMLIGAVYVDGRNVLQRFEAGPLWGESTHGRVTAFGPTSAPPAEPAPLCNSERICATQGFCSRTGATVEPMGNLGGDGGCPRPLPAAPTHPDDAAVDEFAALLKAKLARARAKGRSGWRDPAWSAADINRQLHEHAAKGDPMDVGAYAMFLALRGERTTGPQTANREASTTDASRGS